MIFLNVKPYRLLILLSTLLIANFGYAQENCTNGIDDDGNGLIDSQDPFCFPCYDVSYTIIQEDFEDYNCCPDNLSQTNCINGWEAVSGSPDYVNTCDYLGGGNLIPIVPQPIPSGEGAVGLGGWYETMGTCLDNILLAGESYDISFDVGFNTSNSLQSNLTVEFTIWGANDCSAIQPFGNNPCNNADWYELASFDVVGIENDSWISFSSSFIPGLSANAIAIGHSCDFIETYSTQQYHFIDNIEISGNTGTLLGEIPVASYTGNCTDGVFLEANITTGLAYQWYFEDDIIVGATSNPYQIDADQSGEYTVSILDNFGCTLFSDPILIDIDLEVLDIEASVTDATCATGSDGLIDLTIDSPNLPYSIIWSNGSTNQINDNLAVGTYSVTVTDNNGCFSTGTYTIDEPEKIDASYSGDCLNGVFISVEANPGDVYQWYLDGVLIVGATQNPYEIPSDFPGQYHVVVSNGVSCHESNPLNVDIDLNVIGIGGTVIDLLCFGIPTGSIEVVANDMNPPLTYSWDNGDETQDISNLDAGIYFVTVIDANGCYGEANFTVLAPDPFVNTLTVVQPDMGSPGAAGINSNGGVLPYTYLWNNGNTEAVDNNLASGSYSITVTDGNGCTEVFDFEIVSTYVVVELSTNESCPEDCNGSIELSIDGENSDYSIIWDDDSISGFNPTQLCSGSYSYTVTNSEDSPYIGTVNIESPPEIIISAIYEDSICADSENIDISLSVSGGNAPFSYLWDDGSTLDTLFDVGQGTYYIEVTDSLGCTKIDSFNIEEIPPLELQFETVPTGCDGEEIGAIDMTIINGLPPLDIMWSNDSITEDLNNLGDGWYFVTITDSLGCIANDSVLINPNSGIDVLETLTSINCNGEDDGSISLEITGGELPYDITWSNDEKTESIENLPPGNYEVTIVDGIGCSWTENYNLVLNSDINISSVTEDNECFEDETGSIELTVENATSLYSIIWGDGEVGEDRFDLAAGEYEFSLIDSFGCEYLDTFIITEGPEITYTSIISEPGCNGAEDGLVNISPVTGAFPLTFEWSNGASVNQIDSLSAGTYFLTITDANYCIKLDTFTLSENTDIQASETLVHNLCYGESEGSITLDISGGNQPYDILWSNDETSTENMDLSQGEYFVTIIDANDCSSIYSYAIDEPDSLTIEDFVDFPLCHDDIGSITVQGNGGIPIYDFVWSTGEISQIINVSPGNIYSVTVTDMNQCTEEMTFTIEEIAEIDIVATSIIDPGSLNNDGSITIEVTGGTSPYNITWDNGQTGLEINNLGVGTYTATVIDANNCIQTIVIDLFNEPVSMSGVTTDNLCFGDCQGEIEIAIVGGVEPYDINWSDGQTGPIAIALCNGEYQATIVDGVGDEVISELFSINSPNAISLDGQITNVSCIDVEDGSIMIQSEGGQGIFNYNWSNAMMGFSIDNLGPGDYSVTVMDENGCSQTRNYTIEEIPLIEVEIETLPFDCDDPLGTIIFNGDNIYNYQYLLNGSPIVPNAQNEINDLEAGTYALSYEVSETCIIEIESVIISEKQENDFELSDIEFAVFEGEEVVITLTQGENTFFDNSTVDWIVTNQFNCTNTNENDQCIEITIIVQEAETIEVVITDSDGCETRLEAEINIEERETEIYIPNIFSPNDDGINDEFTISTNDDNLLIESMQIYDRWGNMVYNQKKTDLQNFIFWNGVYNGKKVSPNVFVYRLVVVDRKGETRVIFGDLAVVY